MWWFLLFFVLPVYVWGAYILYVGRHSPSIRWRGRARTKEEAEERERWEQQAADALRMASMAGLGAFCDLDHRCR
jgi:hypothetical protein